MPNITTTTQQPITTMIAQVCNRIPPLWDLANFVAVNPFLGFSTQPLASAAREITDGLDARVLPALAFYQDRWQAHAFNAADLSRVAQRHDVDEAWLLDILNGTVPMPQRAASPIRTFAEQHDQQHGTVWNIKLLRTVSHWCATLVPETSTFRNPDDETFFDAWREFALVDRSLELKGLTGWRDWLAKLPADRNTLVATLLEHLNVAEDDREDYSYRLLGGVYGWASLLRHETWQDPTADPGGLADLLAIRLATDAAVAKLARLTPKRPTSPLSPTRDDETVLAILQEALEDGYATTLLATLAPPPARQPTARPAVQAIFCIDVRSEPLRRHLEAQSAGVETRGFAGFFGVSLDWHSEVGHSARCPVLLQPGVRVAPLDPPSTHTSADAIKHMQSAPVAGFSFVEIAGLAYTAGLAADALIQRTAQHSEEGNASFKLGTDAGGDIGIADRIDMAGGILKNMGLRDSFARLVLLCGHQGQSENNPHAAGLECGACGGHSGAINARVATAILNDPAVREGLEVRGWQVPADTLFVPGVHDTTIDEVTLLDQSQAPASHRADLDQLRKWLAQAGVATRAERAPSLDLKPQSNNLLARLRQRGRDWSEVRPEWALARNAAFIAARRERTHGVDLAGRSFLHEYDWTLDEDDSILSLILSAPMVVASWINLQYFGSTVDNDVFGSGTKALHNRVGGVGVVLGNGGDLRGGLALQSVQATDGSWYHEPLRLQVIVEAPQAKIDTVLGAFPGVNDLIENGWVRLFALDPDSTATAYKAPGTGWEGATF